MARKRKLSDVTFDFINYALVVILTILFLYPMYYVVMASLSDSNLLIAHSGLLLKPLGLNLSAYKMVLEYPWIVTGFKNTLIVVACGVTLNIILTICGAYFLSRRGLSLTNVCMKLIVVTMFFTGGLIPTYLTVRNLGLFDSYLALILPSAINTTNLIIMRTAFVSVPKEIQESAEVDGANDLIILFRIIAPVSMPTIAVIILYYGVAHWNAWFNAMIYIQDRELYPIQLILREILVNNSADSMSTTVASGDSPQISETIKYATVVIVTVPILCIYPFLQKYFVKGIMIGSVKG